MRKEYAMSGLDTVLHLLERLNEERLAARAQDGMHDGLNALCEEARALCPRDTGELQASIHVRMTADCGEVAANAPHAVLLELGTAHSAAQPFLYPAMQLRKGEVMDGVQRAVSDYLKKG